MIAWTASTSSLLVVLLGLGMILVLTTPRLDRRRHAAALALFAAALLTREIAIMLPSIAMTVPSAEEPAPMIAINVTVRKIAIGSLDPDSISSVERTWSRK